MDKPPAAKQLQKNFAGVVKAFTRARLAAEAESRDTMASAARKSPSVGTCLQPTRCAEKERQRKSYTHEKLLRQRAPTMKLIRNTCHTGRAQTFSSCAALLHHHQ
jgi:hypothetical protein